MTNVLVDEIVEMDKIIRKRRVSDVTTDYDLSGAYVNLDPLIDSGADYIIAFSGRSDGKTTSALTYGLSNYEKTGKKVGIIRRFSDEMVGSAGENLFSGVVALNRIREIFGDSGGFVEGKDGEYVELPPYDRVVKYGERWFLGRYDEESGKDIRAKEPFAYGFALNTELRYKSANWEDIGFILFDEFITRNGYLKNEADTLLSMISTIVRDSNGIPVVLCGNVLNRYNPYFEAFDIKEAKDIGKGEVYLFETWDTYIGSNSPVYSRKLVYYSDKNVVKKGKDSDSYFFGLNAKSALMTTKGEWEMEKYPEAPVEITMHNIKRRFTLVFDGEILEGLIVKGEDGAFLYFRRAYAIPNEVMTGKQCLYTLNPTNRRNVFFNLYNSHPKMAWVGKLLSENRVFYESDEVGEVVRNYMQEMRNVQ